MQQTSSEKTSDEQKVERVPSNEVEPKKVYTTPNLERLGTVQNVTKATSIP